MKTKFTQTLLVLSVLLVSVLLSGSLFAGIASETNSLALRIAAANTEMKDKDNTRKMAKETPQLVEVIKDDFRYYFQPVEGGYKYVYAKHDASIEMYEGFAYDDIIKVKVQGHMFSFTMFNGRPVFMSSMELSSR